MAQPTQTTSALRVSLNGLITGATQRVTPSGTTFRTLVKTPAPDHFSNPSTFEVRSKTRLGKPGDMLEVNCELLGYSRSYGNKDGETVRTAEVVLQAV